MFKYVFYPQVISQSSTPTMWACYALDSLSRQQANTLKEAVHLQQEEFYISKHEADLAKNDFRFRDFSFDWLLARQKKFESGVEICKQYLQDEIDIEKLIHRLKEIDLLNIREDMYNLLPKNLQEICNQ